MMNYQAFVLDLDGTLLGDNDQINQVNLNAIRQAIQLGYKVTLASGRPHSLMLSYASELGIKEPLICCNGAYLYHPEKQQVIAESAFARDDLLVLLSSLEQQGFFYTLYTSEGIFASRTSDHLADLELKTRRQDGDISLGIIPDLAQLPVSAGRVYKALVTHHDHQSLDRLHTELSNHYSVDFSAPGKLDITAKGVSKGVALNLWLKNRGLQPEQVVAFGDGDNDISMFDSVGEPVAMENASPSVKRKANLIVTDNNGCGIGQYLRMITLESSAARHHV